MANHQVYDGMTTCGEKKDWNKQKTCDHYEKNSKLNQCMYLKSGWICDYIEVKDEDTGY
jgi:hypothetical protein